MRDFCGHLCEIVPLFTIEVWATYIPAFSLLFAVYWGGKKLTEIQDDPNVTTCGAVSSILKHAAVGACLGVIWPSVLLEAVYRSVHSSMN